MILFYHWQIGIVKNDIMKLFDSLESYGMHHLVSWISLATIFVDIIFFLFILTIFPDILLVARSLKFKKYIDNK